MDRNGSNGMAVLRVSTGSNFFGCAIPLKMACHGCDLTAIMYKHIYKWQCWGVLQCACHFASARPPVNRPHTSICT